MFNYQRVVPSAVEVVGLPLAALSKLIVAELARHLKGPKEVQPCWWWTDPAKSEFPLPLVRLQEGDGWATINIKGAILDDTILEELQIWSYLAMSSLKLTTHMENCEGPRYPQNHWLGSQDVAMGFSPSPADAPTKKPRVPTKETCTMQNCKRCGLKPLKPCSSHDFDFQDPNRNTTFPNQSTTAYNSWGPRWTVLSQGSKVGWRMTISIEIDG